MQISQISKTSSQQGTTSRAHGNADEELEEGVDFDELDESGDSGSEYELSDDEVPFEPNDDVVELENMQDEFADAGIDDDDVMLDAAIQQSLNTAMYEQSGVSTSGAGPSSLSRAPTNKAAALRARAAERRLGLVPKDEVNEVSDSELSVITIDSTESDFDEPLAKTTKKGKGKAKQTSRQERANTRKNRKQQTKEPKSGRGRRSARKAKPPKQPKLTPVCLSHFHDLSSLNFIALGREDNFSSA